MSMNGYELKEGTIMSILKIVFVALLTVPISYISWQLLSRLIDEAIKK